MLSREVEAGRKSALERQKKWRTRSSQLLTCFNPANQNADEPKWNFA
jgi:hypothetical protein